MEANNEKKPTIIHTLELYEPKPNFHIVEGTFKGNPMLNIMFLDSLGKPFSFGVGKAKMVLFAAPEIKTFYEKYKNNLSND